MKFFHFGREVRREITAFNSINVGITPIVKKEAPSSVGCMYLDEESVVGMHPATVPQLFLVIEGEGWVQVEGGEKIKVSKGTAVFWEAGEQHESGSKTGMTAIIIESPSLNPEQFLKSIK
ncbi:cupin domain-containing protein [Neobacillus mesonae]|uniref:Cupin n=1 Tax=Neobacillus mesonae TaxID=1193713 RepID=A0A3T0HSZ5_9BACI|nr:cupin domain-containing protein [Neobacillus mesonae]AZU60239.1 cupin [Neobacillus mesonae]